MNSLLNFGYRAWNTKYSCMYDLDREIEVINGKVVDYKPHGYGDDETELEDLIPMRKTGKIDINGIDIFVGDIILSLNNKLYNIGIVVEYENCFMVEYDNSRLANNLLDCKHIEVIGNTFKNNIKGEQMLKHGADC